MKIKKDNILTFARIWVRVRARELRLQLALGKKTFFFLKNIYIFINPH